MYKIFAIVDCNNFYVSCERVFQPKLEKKPVIVLSNNDGCVIARSNESKALGIKMGDPVFQIQSLIKEHNIKVFSSNYTLYGDMSDRVMQILLESAPRIEIYSIDEAFLDLTNLTEDVEQFSERLVKKIKQWTGLPVSIGLGPTKTLAKAANHLVKKYKYPSGVFNLCDHSKRTQLMNLRVQDVWGIGSKWGAKLKNLGIDNAFQLLNLDPLYIKKKFNVILMSTIQELQGKSCIDIEEMPENRKQIIVSRSFGKRIGALKEIESALANHVVRAAEKLREEDGVASALLVFLQTNPFSRVDAQYHNSITLPLVVPTSDTRLLMHTAIKGLSKIYKEGYWYKKVGVILLKIRQKSHIQHDLFCDPTYHNEKSNQLMQTLDTINQQMGSGSVRFAIQGFRQQWKMKRQRCSPEFTTCWDEIPIVLAK